MDMNAGRTMAQVGRRPATMQRIAFMAPIVVVLTYVTSTVCRAEDGTAAVATLESGALAPVPAAPDAPVPETNLPVPETSVKSDTPGADIPRARVPRPQTHRTVGQGIDETVRRMSRGLDLDPEQQGKLRDILLDQQRQIRKLRSENPQAGVDWAGATTGIVDQTKARIRAMLNKEQKEKYSTDVPREMTAPAQADLQHWMRIQESNRQKDDGDSK
jgi:hypothetical protein